MAVNNNATLLILLNSVNTSYEITKTKIFIGRGNSNDVTLLDATVDPVHASIEKRAESQYYLTNLSTPAKTKVNGSHITGEVLLPHGSTINIGRAQITFTFGEVDVKVKKIFAGTKGNFPIIDSVGGLLDSGYNSTSFAPLSHAHDDRYYTKDEIDDKLKDFSTTPLHHTHPISDIIGLQSVLDGKASLSLVNSHIDNLDNPHETTADQVGAYTKSEVNTLLNAKVDLITGTAGNFLSFNGSGQIIDSGYSALTIPLGTAEDGSYTDGLWTDLTTTTRIGIFADRVNELLKNLSPQAAPDLDKIDMSPDGVSGSLSFGTSHSISTYSNVSGVSNLTAVDIDGVFNAGALSGARHGIYSVSTTSFTGTLASDIPIGDGDPTPAYPVNSFGDGDKGTLKLYVNNSSTPVKTVDLTSFTSGSSLNGNGSGFTLTAATGTSFPNGNVLALFKYRTGTWIATGADLRPGWNFVTVIHTVDSVDRIVDYQDFVRDLDTTATSYSSELLNGFSGSGLKSLSGVKYFTGGSANYAITVSNAYRNTYITTNAVSYENNSTPLQTISSNSLPACASISAEAATYTASKTINITSSGVRRLNESITVKTSVARTVQSTVTSTGSSINNILLDNVPADSTVLLEFFDDEDYRIPSNANFDNESTGTISSWTSTNTIANAGSAGYNSGLQVYGGTLVYPTINFSTITNGPTSNVDYSGCTGARTYYRFFAKNVAANFTLTVSGTATPRAASYSITNSTDDIQIDIKLPNSGGEGTGWLDVTQLFATASWADGDGALLSGSFAMNTAEAITVGTKNTGSATVNGKVFMRIRTPQGWTGSLNSITLA